MDVHPIIVVSGDSEVRHQLVHRLSVEGFAVVSAVSPAHARWAVEWRRPALVIIDLEPPLLDRLLFACRTRQLHGNVPLVATASANMGRYWAGEIDADLFLPKPVDADRLVSATRSLRLLPEPVSGSATRPRILRQPAPDSTRAGAPVRHRSLIDRWRGTIAGLFRRGKTNSSALDLSGGDVQRVAGSSTGQTASSER